MCTSKQRKLMSRLRRRNIGYQRQLKRAVDTCEYCGKKIDIEDRTIDHIIPISVVLRTKKKMENIVTDRSNMVVACKECNNRKGGSIIDKRGYNFTIIEMRKEKRKKSKGAYSKNGVIASGKRERELMSIYDLEAKTISIKDLILRNENMNLRQDKIDRLSNRYIRNKRFQHNIFVKEKDGKYIIEKGDKEAFVALKILNVDELDVCILLQ